MSVPRSRDVASLPSVGHLREFVTHWQFAPLLAVVLVVATATYLLAARVVSRRHPTQPWPLRHTLFFISGIVLIVFVTLGPVGAYDDDFFWAHMTQHIVLMMAAAPLLLLGEPVLLVLRVSSRSFRQNVVIPVLRSRTVGVLTNPVVTWLVFATVLLGTHFTGFFEFALEHPAVHDYVEHSLYLGAGLLYYYPLLGASPGATPIPPFGKVISLFLMMVPETIVGFGIYTAGYVLYPYYSGVDNRPWGPSNALTDQRLGGALMWSAGMIFHALWISVAAWQWIKSEEVKARRIDAGIASGRITTAS